MTGAQLAQAAHGFIGVPFRLHGRDPVAGLDCVGLLEAAFRACGVMARLPARYTLRSHSLPPLSGIAASLGLREARGGIEPGDVLIVRPGPCQHHLAIAAGADRVVHAHAGLRRVVEGPLPAHWPLVRQWRLPPSRI
ncbi:NlpC/P60 family protein [Novosphingobium beihaiensis]|uniref:NlpC/P60 family protein n=1 Tax=Novosphingobium beihaiensis TaxID=2930389 RepID=A0ABT0BVN6_9SPHN|nr:NlpC/P60 family protein [Novosphingobium beihaiensis]MCJ2189130.1 NlpC/P60 family protein [Novosphingobium beihaiensis]